MYNDGVLVLFLQAKLPREEDTRLPTGVLFKDETTMVDDRVPQF